MQKLKLLFVCSQNKWRSLTAEKIFENREGYFVKSAGTEKRARVKITASLIGWADIIFVMEKVHKQKLSKKFQHFIKFKRVICLDIPDEYDYMDVDLINILNQKVLPLLGTY